MSANKHIVGKKPTLRFLLDWYDVWLRQDTWEGAARALEVSEAPLKKWHAAHKDLQEAKALADTRRGTMKTMQDYVFGHLSSDAQDVWEKLQFWGNSSSASIKVEQILSGKTKQLRQELFIHALVSSGFDYSAACRMVHVSRSTFESWRLEPEFRNLVNEIQWHKKNFFEKGLVDLVTMRHPGAVIWANKTINRDRGYGDSVEIEYSGKVDVGISIDELPLDIDTRRKILDAIRQAKQIEPGKLVELTNGHRQRDEVLDAIIENEG